jgi:dCMP deaminase
MPLIHKDRVLGNTHPLNLLEVPDDFTHSLDEVDRPPLYEVYMRMADELAKRSTCARLQVGTVLTDAQLEHVVSIGYNGNARGFANRCDSDQAGGCGCIHSEMNALVKSPGELRDKVAFVTASPCVMCAKLMVQAHVSHVFYRTAYRDSRGLEVLDKAGIVTVHYTRWKDLWRDG